MYQKLLVPVSTWSVPSVRDLSPSLRQEPHPRGWKRCTSNLVTRTRLRTTTGVTVLCTQTTRDRDPLDDPPPPENHEGCRSGVSLD